MPLNAFIYPMIVVDCGLCFLMGGNTLNTDGQKMPCEVFSPFLRKKSKHKNLKDRLPLPSSGWMHL